MLATRDNAMLELLITDCFRTLLLGIFKFPQILPFQPSPQPVQQETVLLWSEAVQPHTRGNKRHTPPTVQVAAKHLAAEQNKEYSNKEFVY